VGFVYCALADDAGVEDDDVGFFGGLGLLVAKAL
jgi:hypothetical protein